MNVVFKNELKLSQVKKLLKTVISEKGKIVRSSLAGSARLEIAKGQYFTLVFKSNLELRKLV